MIFDTDIFIWMQRGNVKAARLIEQSALRQLSIQTFMELLQCAQHRSQQQKIKSFLADFGFTVLPFTENIGHRALVYIEEYSLPAGLRAGDAVIAATATENNLPLATGNHKHFKVIKELQLKVFRP